MKKTVLFRLLLSLFSLLTAISLIACSSQEADEAARKRLVQTLDQILEEKITLEKAKKKIENLSIPDDTALGYAMTKYKQNILSDLESQKTDSLAKIRNLLENFHEKKDSDVYYKAFQDQLKNNDNLRDYTAFMDEMKTTLSKIPNYEIVKVSDEKLDLGCTVHSYTINCTKFEDSFSLTLETAKDNKITQAKLSRTMDKNGNGNFAAVASYVYRCMGFEIEGGDYEAFYEKYDLRSEGNIHQSFYEGDYQITCATVNLLNKINFSITANEAR